MMTYHLLTGATGLLGSYLVREFLRAGRPLAVVVRSSNRESARQRIENVVVRWEKEAGYALPRPVIFDGDILKEDLGLTPRTIDWLAANCQSVIHSAASLTFHANDRHGEPRRTNFDGTRNVLGFCRRAGVRQFHHVSTAFICGLRSGRILESELDLGQAYGNPYEKSKIEAEKLVRAADYLDRPTIYRPGTIVGDSRTGYTATYHGFYAPLKLVAAVADKVDMSLGWGAPLMELLGLSGTERKSFVPVDWVAAVLAYLHGRPEHHGQVYHLTPRKATPVSLVTEVMEEVLRENVRQPAKARATGADDDFDVFAFGRMFQEQMDVYKSHWRDDPEFDSTNTQTAAPHLPCPEMTREMLKRIATFAIRANFGWPRPAPVKPAVDVQQHLARLLQHAEQSPTAVDGAKQTLGLQVTGPGGGQWELVVEGSRPIAAEQGIRPGCSSRFYLNSRTFQQLAACQTTVPQAVCGGEILFEGDGVDQAEAVLQAAVTEEA